LGHIGHSYEWRGPSIQETSKNKILYLSYFLRFETEGFDNHLCEWRGFWSQKWQKKIHFIKKNYDACICCMIIKIYVMDFSFWALIWMCMHEYANIIWYVHEYANMICAWICWHVYALFSFSTKYYIEPNFANTCLDIFCLMIDVIFVWMHVDANTCYEFSFYECMNMLTLVMTFFSNIYMIYA